MQLNNNIKFNKKYNIYFTDIKTFKEKLKNEYLYEFIFGKGIKEKNLKYFEVSYFFNDIFKYKFFKPIKKGKLKMEKEIYYMVHYLEKDEEYLKKQGIKLKKCIKVKGETFKKIEKNKESVEYIFYYYNKFYVKKELDKYDILLKNSFFVLWNFFTKLLYSGELVQLKVSKKNISDYYYYYKQLKSYKKTINYLDSYKSNIYYEWINGKKKWGKVKNFNYSNYDKIKKDKYNVYFISVLNFRLNFGVFYKEIFTKNNKGYLFDTIIIKLLLLFNVNIWNKIKFDDIENYFMYTCILKQKKIYKKYIKYKIEFMLHVHEIDIEYFKNIKTRNLYKKDINEVLKNCNIIRKGETLKDVYLKYIYKNEKKRTIIIRESKKIKEVKSKFLVKMKKFKRKKKPNELLKV